MYPLLLLLLLASGAAAQGAERAGVEGSERRSGSGPSANPRGATQRTFRTTGDGTAIQTAGIARPTGSAALKATCTARTTLSPGGGRTIVDLSSNGSARTFTLALPSSSSAQMPLLLALHGGAQYASGFLDMTGFDTAGPAAGYVVAAPDGLPGSGGVGGTWALNNDPGDGAGDVYNDVDDKVFIRDVVSCIRSLGVSLSGDLYVTGWSLGAKFATRLACAPAVNNATVPLQVVALTVASGVQAEAERACNGAPVPLLMIQGGADQNVPLCTTAAIGEYAYEPTAPHLNVFAQQYNRGNGRRTTTCGPLGTTHAFVFSGTSPTGLLYLVTGGHAWTPGVTNLIDGCNGDSTAIALAFFASVRAGGTPNLLPASVCPGLSSCNQPLPCPEYFTSGGPGLLASF